MESSDTSLLTPSEVALRLGVSRSWIYAAAKQGRIPCVRLGGDDGPVRFLEAELAAWLLRSRPEQSPGGRSSANGAHASKNPSERSTSRRDARKNLRTVQQLSWSLTDHPDARPDRRGS
jgi:excisionase family DNA binding protein